MPVLYTLREGGEVHHWTVLGNSPTIMEDSGPVGESVVC